MREKDHSPRKMLPSPKQGAIYPNGLPLPALQLPFDLITAINRPSSSASSNDSPSPSSHRHEQTDQPLDLRVEHKKSSLLSKEIENENDNDHDHEDENSNSIIANNNYVKSESNHEKSPSPVDLNNKNFHQNAKRLLSNHHLNLNGLSAQQAHRLSNTPLFPPPSLHPLMLEAMAKAARLRLPKNTSRVAPHPSKSSASFRAYLKNCRVLL